MAHPSAFPDVALADLSGEARPLSGAWSTGPALILVGHSGCDTTRFTLPFVDRIHRRRGPGAGVAAVLQDEPVDARELKESLGLDLPLLLEPAPHGLAAELDLAVVPTLYLVAPDGRIEAAFEAYQRKGLEQAARRLGVDGALFTTEDRAPATRPG